MRPVRVGVAGAGYWGKNLVRTFATVAGSHLVAIADGSAEVRGRMARRDPGVELLENATELFRRPDIDAVVPATYAELTLAALAEGKDVYVEKPLALGVHTARKVQEATERSARIVQVGHLLRYHPAVECQHFVDCIREDRTPLSDGLDGIRVGKVLEAGDESLRRDGELIRLP